eukprot:COSAG05_NODE_1489_length_4725_cov_10.311933_5_plen_227_part_00
MEAAKLHIRFSQNAPRCGNNHLCVCRTGNSLPPCHYDHHHRQQQQQQQQCIRFVCIATAESTGAFIIIVVVVVVVVVVVIIVSLQAQLPQIFAELAPPPQLRLPAVDAINSATTDSDSNSGSGSGRGARSSKPATISRQQQQQQQVRQQMQIARRQRMEHLLTIQYTFVVVLCCLLGLAGFLCFGEAAATGVSTAAIAAQQLKGQNPSASSSYGLFAYNPYFRNHA